MMAQYKGAAFGELSSHAFAVADATYRLMINEGISQSILVSGDSGAGKTESTKLLMRYLAYMGGSAAAEGRIVEQNLEAVKILAKSLFFARDPRQLLFEADINHKHHHKVKQLGRVGRMMMKMKWGGSRG